MLVYYEQTWTGYVLLVPATNNTDPTTRHIPETNVESAELIAYVYAQLHSVKFRKSRDQFKTHQ